MLQDQVLPLLQERGRAVPVEGELEDHDVVVFEQLLLPGHIHMEARVGFIQVVEGQVRMVGDPPEEFPVDP